MTAQEKHAKVAYEDIRLSAVARRFGAVGDMRMGRFADARPPHLARCSASSASPGSETADAAAFAVVASPVAALDAQRLHG